MTAAPNEATVSPAGSLATRLTLFIAGWLLIALLATGLLLSTLFATNARQNFRALLQAHAYNLIAVVDEAETGELTGAPDLGDPRFRTPLSGWTWSITTAIEPSKPLLSSLNVSGPIEAAADDTAEPFGEDFARSYLIDLPAVGEVRRLETQLYFGEGDTLYQVNVSGLTDDVREAIGTFNRSLILVFGVFAIASMAASYLIVRLGLRPLRSTTNALSDLREGRAERIEGRFPTEIAPLAAELNALLDANRAVLERARTQVGNLAHALKTPLAVIQNEARSQDRASDAVVAQQAVAMRDQIDTYLDRARIAAQRGSLNARTPVEPMVARLLGVMRKLFRDKSFEAADIAASVHFRGEEQDLEELLGSLLENAARHANGEIRVSCQSRPQDGELVLIIEDDGPGMTFQQREIATQRGRRFDESKPGSGLGLSIVQDIAVEYGGRLELGVSKLGDGGGLRAAVFLPSAASRS